MVLCFSIREVGAANFFWCVVVIIEMVAAAILLVACISASCYDPYKDLQDAKSHKESLTYLINDRLGAHKL